MPMQMGFRWYGEGNDNIKLSDIKQIPGVTSIVWALHHKLPGEIWEVEEIAEVQKQLAPYGFNMDVVESVNVHDDIKIGLPTRDQYIENYCLRNGLRRDELIFPLTERAIQKQLKIVCDYLGFEGISTHSFRKWYATEIYKNSGYDIALVQRLLQHSSAATTQRYIGIESQRIEMAIQNHANLI